MTTNKRYKDLKVTEGTYVPPVTRNYPEDDPYVGLYKPVYDRDYPEIDAKLFVLSILLNNFLFQVIFSIPLIILIQEEMGFIPQKRYKG